MKSIFCRGVYLAENTYQAALDLHHASPMMAQIAQLRERYDLHMRVERYLLDEKGVPASDQAFIR